MSKRERSPDWEWDDRDDITDARERKKAISQEWWKETREHGFGCDHCHEWAPINEEMGTHNRNHCPHCLWSKHLDDTTPGDRKSDCKQGMRPIALTFKGESADKYATAPEQQLGELMLVHECVRGDQIRINRIAADDNPHALVDVFHAGHHLPPDTRQTLGEIGITVASQDLSHVVMRQLFGGPEDFHA